MTPQGRADAPKATTIADVAALAGVSVPTVSRVLTGAAKVSPGKRDAVEKAIAELKFRPSAAARFLASRRSQTIAIITGDTSRYGYAETIRGIEEEARARDYNVLITVVDSAAADAVGKAMSALLEQPLAGVIVLNFDPPGVAALHALPSSLPVVALSGLREPAVSQAVLDEEQAAFELTGHLLSLGHRTVQHVRVPPSREEDGRTTGWRRALVAAGAEVPAVLDAGWEPRSGVALGRRLAAETDATAVFCGNDEIAMGVIHGLRLEGRRIPDDISVAGFDDHPLAELWSPPLTTVRQDFADLGGRGMLLLLQSLEEPGVRFSSSLPTLVLRGSTAPPRLPYGGRAPASDRSGAAASQV